MFKKLKINGTTFWENNKQLYKLNYLLNKNLINIQ